MGNRGFFGPGYIEPTNVWLYDNFMRPEGAYYGPTIVGDWLGWPWGNVATPTWGVAGNHLTSLTNTNESRIYFQAPATSYAFEVQLAGWTDGGIIFRSTGPRADLLLHAQSNTVYTYIGTTYTARYTVPVACSTAAMVRIETTPTNFKIYYDGVLVLNQDDTTYYPSSLYFGLRCNGSIGGDRYKSIGLYKL